MSNLERKAETRQKILMGGLMKKAGLEQLHEDNPSALLGLLIELKDKIRDLNQSELKEYETTGKDNW